MLNTMEHPRQKAWKFGLAEVFFMLAIGSLLVFIGWQIYSAAHRQTAPSAYKTGSAESSTLTNGNDNDSLGSDLTSIASGVSQSDQNLKASDAAINDQQNQITIPAE